MAVVGTAYVKVQAISTGLAEEIKRQVKSAIREASSDIDKDMEAAGRSGGKAYGKGFSEEASKGVKAGMKDVIDEAERAGGDEADRAGDRVGARFGDGVSNSFKRNVGSKLKTAMGIVGKALKWGALLELLPSAIGVAMGTGAAAVTGLTAAVTGLGAAAAGAGVAMVAGLAPLAQGMIVMKLAMEANKEQAKHLTENWKGFKNEIGKAVGERMFGGLEAAVDSLKSRFTGNEGVMSAFKETGDVIGRVTQFIAESATNDMGRFERIILANNNALMGIGGGVAGLTEGFVILLDAMGPITREIGDMAGRFGAWVRDTLAAKSASGELQATLMTLWNALKQIGRIVRDIGSGLFNIFKLAAPQAKEMGNSVEDMAKKFKEWTQSEAGQEKIRKFFEDSTRIAKELGKLIKDIFTGWSDGSKNFDADAIISVMETMRTTWLPAIKDIVHQITDALDIGESGDFFKNIGQSLQNIADSGIVGKIVTQLSDLVTKLGEVASSPAGTTILGIVAALSQVPGGVSLAAKALGGLFGGGGAAGGGGGGGGGGAGGFLGKAKGLLKGGIVAFIAGEILSAASEDFDAAWGDLWGAVFGGAATALKGTLDIVGTGLAVPANWLASIVHATFGDDQAAREATKRAGEAWDEFKLKVSEIDTWFGDRASEGEKKDIQAEIFGDFDGKAFTEATKIVSEGIAQLNSSGKDLGAIAPQVQQAWMGISNMLSRSPIPDDLKTKIADQWSTLTSALATGNQDLGKETTAIEQTLHDMELMDPSFKPVADKIRQEMSYITRLIPENGQRWNDAWNNVFDSVNKVMSDPSVMGTGFQEWGTNITSGMNNLKTAIEENGDIDGALQKVFADLDKVKPGDPQSVKDARDNIVNKLAAMGVDVEKYGFKVTDGLNKAFIEGAAKVGPQAAEAVAAIPREAYDAMNKSFETNNFAQAAALLADGLKGVPEEIRTATVASVAEGQSWGPQLLAAFQGSFDPAKFKDVAKTFGDGVIAELQKMPKDVVDAVAAAVAAGDTGAIASAFGSWLSSSVPPELQKQATLAAAAAGIIPQSVADSIVAGINATGPAITASLQTIPAAFSAIHSDIAGMDLGVGTALDKQRTGIESGIEGLVGAVQSGKTDISSELSTLNQAFAGADISFEPMRAKIAAELTAAGVDVGKFAPNLAKPLAEVTPAATAAGEQVAQGFASGLRGTGPGAASALSDVPGQIGTALTPSQEAAKQALLGVPHAAGDAVGTTAAVVASGLQGTPGAVSQALNPAAAAATGAMQAVPGAAATAVAPTAGQVQAGLVTVPASVLASLDPSVAAAATAMAPVPTTAGAAVAPTAGNVQSGLSGVPGAVSTALAGVPGAVTAPMDQAAQAAAQKAGEIKASPNQLSGIQGLFSAQLQGVAPAVTAMMNLAVNAMRTILQMMLSLPSAILGGIAGVVSAALGGIVGAVTSVMMTTLSVMSSYMSQIASRMSGFISTLRSQKAEIDSIMVAAEQNKARAEQIAREAKAAVAAAQADKATADAANAAAASARAAAAAATANAFIPPQGWVLRHVVSAADFGTLQGGWQPPYGRGLSGTRVAHITMPEPVIKTTTTSTSAGDRISVQVYIGQSELEEIIDKRVSYGDAQLDRKIRHGRRGVNQ